MYLYFFERILRAASGDPNLALPYWNYNDLDVPDPKLQLPPAFWQPADSSNPLFVSQRAGPMNDGTGFLDPASVDTSRAFDDMHKNFEASAGLGLTSFGGSAISQPAHFAPRVDGGALENTPHDPVHGEIGGPLPQGGQTQCDAGWMSDPQCSARDPIFLLHHANIDRLWKQWLAKGGGRQDPTFDQGWMNTMFTFFDENGGQVQLSGKDILDTVGQLNYNMIHRPKAHGRRR
jgi:tyrosinase